MKQVKVLVTGCAGYVGSVLCQQLLADGFDVAGVDTLMYNNESALGHLLGHRRFTFHLHDARDVGGLRPLVRRADAVVPLAAVVGGPACDQKPDYARDVNLGAVLALLREVSAQQRVVFPNTNSGYGETDGEKAVTEDDPLTPVSLYGVTKVAAERAVLEHPNAASLRLATVFGPSPRMRFDLMVNDFTCRLLRRGRLEVFEPTFVRNFVHVRDVARVFVRMLADHRLTGPFNVGLPDANLTKIRLAQAVAGYLGLPEAAVAVGEGHDPDRRNYRVSNARLLATGFDFHYPLKRGVLDVAQLVGLLTPPAIARMRNA